MKIDENGYITEMSLDEAMAMITESRMVAARGNGKSILEHNRSVAWVTIVNSIYENKRLREKSHMSEVIVLRNGFATAKWSCTNCGKTTYSTYSDTFTDEEIIDRTRSRVNTFCPCCGARLKEDENG